MHSNKRAEAFLATMVIAFVVLSIGFFLLKPSITGHAILRLDGTLTDQITVYAAHPSPIDKDQVGKYAVIIFNPSNSSVTITEAHINTTLGSQIMNQVTQGAGLSFPTTGWTLYGGKNGVSWTGSYTLAAGEAIGFWVSVKSNKVSLTVPLYYHAKVDGVVYSDPHEHTAEQLNGNLAFTQLAFNTGDYPVYNLSTNSLQEKTYAITLQESSGKISIPSGVTMTIKMPSGFSNLKDTGGTGWAAAGINGNIITVNTNQALLLGMITYSFNATAPSQAGLYAINATMSGDTNALAVLEGAIKVVCMPLLTNTSWSEWMNITGCQMNNTVLQSRNLTQYDSNYCGIVSNQTFIEEQTVACTYCTPSWTNTSWSSWYNITACQMNDTYMQARNRTQYDLNNCPASMNTTFYEYQALACDYCTPVLANTSWTGWYNITGCQMNDTVLQERNKTQYDTNYCNEVANVTYFEHQEAFCDYCTPLLVNQTGDWINVSCLPSSKMNQTRTTIQYDSNYCNEVANQTFIEYQAVLDCFYCATNLVNTSWTAWYNKTSCQINDTLLQERNRTQYDANNCPGSINQTFFEQQTAVCDYCTPNWVAVNDSCNTLDVIVQWYNDTNDCFAQTGLSSDNMAPPTTLYDCNYCSYNVTNTSWTDWQNQTICYANSTQLQNRSLMEYDANYFTCYSVTGLASDLWNSGNNNTYWDYQWAACVYVPDEDEDFIPDSQDNLIYNEAAVASSGLTSLDIVINGTTNIDGNGWNGTFDVGFYDNGVLFMNFTHDFTLNKIDLSNVTIEKTSLGIAVNLSGQLAAGETKEIYVNDNSFISLCVKDAEIASISAITADCTGENETDFTACLGNSSGVTLNGTTCYDLGAMIKVTNLSYSGIVGKQAAVVSGGGGGGKKIAACTPMWECTDWSDCNREGFMDRKCIDLNNCNKLESKPSEKESCKPSPLFKGNITYVPEKGAEVEEPGLIARIKWSDILLNPGSIALVMDILLILLLARIAYLKRKINLKK